MKLDHKAAIAKYGITMEKKQKEHIPKENYFSGWVISKQMENDKIFLSKVKDIFDDIVKYANEIEIEKKDWTLCWILGKEKITEEAQKLERQYTKMRNERKSTLQVLLKAIVRSMSEGENKWNEYYKIKEELHAIEEKEINCQNV